MLRNEGRMVHGDGERCGPPGPCLRHREHGETLCQTGKERVCHQHPTLLLPSLAPQRTDGYQLP